MKIGEPHALAVQSIEVRGFEYWIAVTGQVSVTLVIGQNEDHIWLRWLPPCLSGEGWRQAAEEFASIHFPGRAMFRRFAQNPVIQCSEIAGPFLHKITILPYRVS